MIENLPIYISLIFGLTTVATVLLFYWSVKKSVAETTRNKANAVLLALTGWLIIQGVLTLLQVYHSNLNFTPPKILLFGIWPALLIIVFLFASRKGRAFIDSLPLIYLTYLNIIRIPVELGLFWLFLNKTIPQLMTFEGRNFDILSGITAPFIAYLGLTKGKLSRQMIVIWNLACLALLLNIVVNGFLSVPTPFQKFGFDQPNMAILYFPFSWLPTCIVPLVLFGHLVSIRQLLHTKPT